MIALGRLLITAVLLLSAVIPAPAADSNPPRASIVPGAIWPDERGHHIQAHGGGILKLGDTYYWFGEDRGGEMTNKKNLERKIACYASKDLLNWEFRNQVIRGGPPAKPPGHAPGSANPIPPGYVADPTIISDQGIHYLYATLDPRGGDTLGCWTSADLANGTYRALNLPTKAACTSPTSKGAKVWAPSVVRARDGRFVMCVSVGSEIWTGVANHPLGPWRNALGDRPLVPGDFRPGFHMIDAEVFLDDDGQAYLYRGLGGSWTNARCFVAKLKPDLVTFDGEVRDATPTN